MNFANLRWPVMVATAAVTLAALFGGGYLVKSKTVDVPLDALLNGSSVVESHTVDQGAEKREIKVKLKETADLQRDYQTLDDEIKKLMQGAPYTIKVEDRRNPDLEKLNHRLNLFVQEALATGHFAEMADQIDREAAKAGATARFTVDENRVYLQLKGADGYLYSVVERPKAQALPTALGGGIGL